MKSRCPYLNNQKHVKKTSEAFSPEMMADKVVLKQVTKVNKDQPHLKRRTTYVALAPAYLNVDFLYNNCYVEYCGTDKDEGSSTREHGNTKTKPDMPKRPYHAQHHKVLESVYNAAANNTKNSRNLLNHLNPSNPQESVRNYRVVANQKAKHRREVLGIRGNTVDDIIKIITQIEYKREHSIRKTFGDTFRRQIPSVAAWRDWHMKTIPNVCRWDTLAVVLAQDITFNLVSLNTAKIYYY